VSPLSLAEDTIVVVTILDGSFVCVKFTAEGSTGTLDCGAGVDQNVTATKESGPDSPPAVLTIEPGDATGPGSAVLQLAIASAQLPAGSDPADCESAAYGDPEENVLTTATATAIMGAVTGSIDGENFDCDNWTTEDGPGMLVMPLPGYNEQAGGDAANNYRFADADL
jgi:hypothetical protein